MENIGTGHWIFAGVFAIVFIIIMIYAYRQDLKKIGFHYRHIWILLVVILVIYFAIFYLNRLT